MMIVIKNQGGEVGRETEQKKKINMSRRDEGNNDRDRGEQQRSGVSLLVRNLSFDSSPHDIRRAFEKFGEVRDVYIPKDYHSG